MEQQVNATLQQLLCPAGDGVYTVSSGNEKKTKLQQQLYGTSDEQTRTTWQEHLAKLPQTTSPLLLGVCSDTGGGIQRGANWGPLAIREQLLDLAAAHTTTNYFDLGDVRVIPQLLHDKYLKDDIIKNCRAALYNDPTINLPVSPLSITEHVAKIIYETYPNTKLLSLGGDHSISYPLVKSYLAAKQKHRKQLAVIHFDAHTDLLNQRLGVDLCFGSWAYHILPDLAAPENLVQLGIRASAKAKNYWESVLGVKQFWAVEFTEHNLDNICDQVITHLHRCHVKEIYISFDIDAIDARYASATGTPEPNGLHPEVASKLITELANNFRVTGADLVEVAPFVTNDLSDLPQPQTTLSVAGRIANHLLAAMDVD